jgi:O-6-methylguanine DNA methyltransferase
MSAHLYTHSPFGLIHLEERNSHIVRLNFVESAVLNSQSTALLMETEKQLKAYFNGQLKSFDLPVDIGFQGLNKSVLDLVLDIPFGQVRTYKEIGAELGNTRLAQAVGRANAGNPVLLLIPCHRVIGSDGDLRGYAAGLHIKRRLLRHEGYLKQNSLF